ncbi:SMC-Scp complex subunit ScpB [Dialister sp.]|uniref:SMC-Scp complex subunit ScpB n=1 Tax=Dialister sp. TaxID=1955814 RepID=UPI003F116FB9
MKGPEALAPLIEAFLFARGTPASLKELGKALGEDTVSVEKGLEYLASRYAGKESGITLHHTGAGYSLATKKEYDQWLSSLLGKQTPLSPAALETLAVVACREPVTRAEIEKIRGVSAGRVISLLMEKDLLEERGRLDVPGRPILYGTTRRFLQCTGLNDVSELKTRWSGKPDEGELF